MKLPLKYLALAVIALIAMAVFVSDSVQAQAIGYTWTYSKINVYNGATITYDFDNLTIGNDYRWDLYAVDEETGSPTFRIGFHELLQTTTVTATAVFGGASSAAEIRWPDGYVGPVAVLDSTGPILGKHYVTQIPGYFLSSPNTGWYNNNNTTFGEKQVVGVKDVQGTCRNPVYAPVNSDGWQHTYIPCSVATTTGGFAILHYQIPAAYVGPTDQKIRFYPTATTNLALTIDIDDLIDYNPPTVTGDFIIINTAGTLLPFVDNPHAIASFVTDDNPLTAELEPGVYNYVRSSPTFISDGESVWIITDDSDGNEWGIEAVSSVGEGGQQTVRTTAVTPEVWTNYHGFQSITDATAGFSDTTVYAFARSRNHAYTTGSSPASGVIVEWINRAAALNAGLATPAEMEFRVSDTYTILEVVTLEENLEQVLRNTGLDTDVGRGVVLTLILVAGMLGISFFQSLRGSLFVYMMVWAGLGSLFVIGGFGTVLVNTMYLIITIALWLVVLVLAQGTRDEDY